MAQMFKTTIMIMISSWNLCFGFSPHQVTSSYPKRHQNLKKPNGNTKGAWNYKMVHEMYMELTIIAVNEYLG